MSLTQKLILLGGLFLAAFGTGLWLPAAGGFLHPFLTVVHKLLAVGATIYGAVLVIHAIKSGVSGAAFFFAVAVLGLSMVVLFLSGSILTRPEIEIGPWLLLHRIGSAAAACALAVALRLFALKA